MRSNQTTPHFYPDYAEKEFFGIILLPEGEKNKNWESIFQKDFTKLKTSASRPWKLSEAPESKVASSREIPSNGEKSQKF